METNPSQRQLRLVLGLREVDLGGPASGGCWAISTEASREELNAALVAADLPFRVAEFGWRYRNAAEQGDATAQRSLGFLYANGEGIMYRAEPPRGYRLDYAEAARWYRMAADQGDASAQHNLSLLRAWLTGAGPRR